MGLSWGFVSELELPSSLAVPLPGTVPVLAQSGQLWVILDSDTHSSHGSEGAQHI